MKRAREKDGKTRVGWWLKVRVCRNESLDPHSLFALLPYLLPISSLRLFSVLSIEIQASMSPLLSYEVQKANEDLKKRID